MQDIANGSHYFQQYDTISQCSETPKESYNECEGSYSEEQESWICC